MSQPSSPIRNAATLFAAIAETLDQADQSAIAATGLPTSQIRALYMLYNQQTATIGQLAQALEVGLPTASYHVDQLVEAELVERAESKTDRRAKIIRLSPKGLDLIQGFVQAQLDQMENWLTHLAAPELEMLLKGLQALAQVSLSATGTAPDTTANEP